MGYEEVRNRFICVLGVPDRRLGEHEVVLAMSEKRKI
jgi:hypothetical protein